MSFARQRYGGGQRKPVSAADGVKAVSSSSSALFSGPGGGGAAHPNEPAGFTPLCENEYQVVPGAVGGGWLQNQPGASGWWWNNGDPDNLAIRTNGGHPLASTYLEIKFPVDLPSGVGPAFFIGWSTPAPTQNHQMRELYVQTVFRWRGPAGTEGTFAFEPTLSKMYYVAYKSLNNFNQGTFNSRGRPAGTMECSTFNPYPLCSEVGNHFGTAQAGTSNTITLATTASTTNGNYDGGFVKITGGQGAGPTIYNIPDPGGSGFNYVGSTRVATISGTWAAGIPNATSQYAVTWEKPGGALHFGDNVSSAALTVNQWYMAEDYWKLNTQDVPAVEDGIRRTWVDNILRGDHTDVRYSTIAPWNIGFHQYRFDPVWGGVTPGLTVPYDQYLDVAYSYLSGVFK